MEVFLASQAVIGRWVGGGKQRIPFARLDSQENRPDSFCAPKAFNSPDPTDDSMQVNIHFSYWELPRHDDAFPGCSQQSRSV